MGSCGGALEVRGRRFAPKVPMTILSQLTDAAVGRSSLSCLLHFASQRDDRQAGSLT